MKAATPIVRRAVQAIAKGLKALFAKPEDEAPEAPSREGVLGWYDAKLVARRERTTKARGERAKKLNLVSKTSFLPVARGEVLIRRERARAKRGRESTYRKITGPKSPRAEVREASLLHFSFLRADRAKRKLEAKRKGQWERIGSGIEAIAKALG